MFIIEDYPLENPNYHEETDTLDTLDLDLQADVARALTAAVAVMAADL